jgi:hypothetical protein
MLKRSMAALALLLTLPSCVGLIVADGSRNVTKDVVIQVLAKDRPDVDPKAGAACVTNAMTYGEILKLGTSDVTPVTPSIEATVRGYAARPEASACLDALVGQAA